MTSGLCDWPNALNRVLFFRSGKKPVERRKSIVSRYEVEMAAAKENTKRLTGRECL